jgi:hypothetical protein
MFYHLPHHVSFGRVAGDIVVLDVRADRYIRLGPDESAVLEAVAAGTPRSYDLDLAERLATRGVIAQGEGPCSEAVVAPQVVRSAVETEGSVTPVGLLEVARARAYAALSLRFCGLSRTISRWRQVRAFAAPVKLTVSASQRETQIRAAGIARGFARSRLFLPAQRRCVPDGLALLACVKRRGIFADLYFGVRLAPFAAHCWVQAGDELLSDPLDIIREFSPVFRL